MLQTRLGEGQRGLCYLNTLPADFVAGMKAAPTPAHVAVAVVDSGHKGGTGTFLVTANGVEPRQ
jgi:hypothetical protein